MPTVEFTCDKCDTTFEVDTADLSEEEPKCPRCGESESLSITGLFMDSACGTGLFGRG